MPRHPNRRETLGGLAALAALGCTPDTAPGDDDDDSAVSGEARIDTTVILMMENRSFDHYFGALSLEEGRAVDGLSSNHFNLDATGAPIAPFWLREFCPHDPPHGWDSIHRQIADGAMSGFVSEFRGGSGPIAEQAIGYHNRQDLPILYALADDNVLCQRWFCSVPGPTMPNRWYATAGHSDGRKSNVRALLPGPNLFTRLSEAGVEWGVYFHDLPANFTLMGIEGARFHPIEQFFEDAAAGRLPEVVWIEPGYELNDDHPPRDIRLGQLLIGTLYRALAESPQWENSRFVVNYDEHGGFYDHVGPPRVEDDRAADGFDLLGVRVPGLVCGPWARQGLIDDTQYDHTSVLAELQAAYGLPSFSLRTDRAADLSATLDLDRWSRVQPRAATVLPTISYTEEELMQNCRTASELTARPSQPELIEMLEMGLIPRHLDRRREGARILRHLFDQAERLGLLRVR